MATVLFINDRTCTSQITIQRLRACGYAVELAIDADEAVRLLRLHLIDAIVMDCHIEASSPTDVLAALRSTSANIPIVMMSAYCGVPCKVLRYADLCIQKGDFKLLSRAAVDRLLQVRSGVLQPRNYAACPLVCLPRVSSSSMCLPSATSISHLACSKLPA